MAPLAGQVVQVVATGTRHIGQGKQCGGDIEFAIAAVYAATQTKAVEAALCELVCEFNDGFSRSVDAARRRRPEVCSFWLVLQLGQPKLMLHIHQVHHITVLARS
jgi:hypothetical protein